MVKLLILILFLTVPASAGIFDNGIRTWFLSNTTDSVGAVQSGAWAFSLGDGTKASYSAGIAGVAPAASATDIFVISGSASKTIRVTHCQVTMTTTSGSGASTNLSLIKRSTLDTAGTSSTLANVPHDSTNAAGTAVVKSYTANPSALGTSVGVIRAERYAVATSNTVELLQFDFGNRPAQAIVLRGTSENLAINLNGATPTGASASIDVEWTEE